MTAWLPNLRDCFKERVAAVKDAIDVQRLYAELHNVTVRPGGTAQCFNEAAHRHGDRHPSMQVRQNGYRCFACGVAGDAITLVRQCTGASFIDAVRILEGKVGIAAQAESRTGSAVAAQSTQSRGARARRIERAEPCAGSEFAGETAELHAAFWELVRDDELTRDAVNYLSARGIGPKTAQWVGCRDWQPRVLEILKLLRQFRPQVQAAAGFARIQNGEVQLWWPLRALAESRSAFRGLAIPAFLPGEVAPRTWRWRLYVPLPRASGGNPYKSIAMYGRQLPFGLNLAPRALDWFWSAAGCDIIVIAEGEMDWLAFLDAMQATGGVIGLSAAHGGVPREFLDCLAAAKAVAIALHDTPAADGAASAVADAVHGLGRKRGERVRIMRWPFAEHDDANDCHKRGELREFINRELHINVE